MMSTSTSTCNLSAMLGRATSGIDHKPSHQLVRQVALKLFSEIGFHNVSLRKLANTLEMQPGSLYNHIDGKQELLFELIDEYETDLLDAIKVDLPAGSSPEHRLSAYIRSHLGFNASSPQHRSIAQLEFRNLTPNQQKIIEAIRAEYTFILAEIIQHGILTQAFRPMPLQVATRLILSMLTEMSREDKSNATLTIEDSTTLLHETVLRILHT
ncbi:TetR/AcrR family transcriptional regulator [Pseudomonas aeruginosa]|uniref:TetR/AcrR family transcriptional regulator n=1 Tax=Pseudomonas aeruginosa TaxID=287 RepID=UPI0013CE182E|nr:TetR/AcrR family transcriptional regulator [Pseudomonas aeruginosa]